MGHLGFSYVGLIYLLMLTVPNILWTRNQPKDYDFSNENKVLLIFERAGQVGTTTAVLIFSDFNFRRFSAWSLWLAASFVLMLLYEVCWLRYFKGEHTEKDFYGSFCGMPVPLASLPVTAFLLMGIYGRVFWLIVPVIILGIGHIGIHIGHLKTMRERNKTGDLQWR